MSTLYVGGLPASADADSLRSLFEAFASVVSVRLIEQDTGGPHRGFGYVTFTDATEAEQAIESLDGTSVDASRLRVAPAV